MKYRTLGDCGLKVSELCLGTMTWGEANEASFMHGVCCDEETSFEIMNQAVEAGINFFDTADVYGQEGLAERVIGKWFQKEKKRHQVVLATKFRFRMDEGPNGTGASRYRLVRCVEDSLRRLNTDHLDVYQVHMQDIETPEEETLRALDDVIRSGKVLYIGASNYAAYRLVDSLWLSRSLLLNHFVSLQAEYNLLTRDLEREHVPLCQKFNLGILPWSPLAGGFLSGKYRAEGPPPVGTRLARWQDLFGEQIVTPRNFQILRVVQEIASELSATPAAVALAWLLDRPTVTSVIFGVRSVNQLHDNLRAAALVLPEAATKRLDDVSALSLEYPYAFMKNAQGRW